MHGVSARHLDDDPRLSAHGGSVLGRRRWFLDCAGSDESSPPHIGPVKSDRTRWVPLRDRSGICCIVREDAECLGDGRRKLHDDGSMTSARSPALIKTFGLVLGVSLLAGALWVGFVRSGPTPDFLIAFVSTREGQPGLFVMHSDGSPVRRLTTDTALLIQPGAWSSDGRRILFFPVRPGLAHGMAGPVPRANLDMHVSPPFVIDADGQHEQRLSDQIVIPDCRWSPDSTRIVCSSGVELPEGVALYIF